jgi:hypothetical protein
MVSGGVTCWQDGIICLPPCRADPWGPRWAEHLKNGGTYGGRSRAPTLDPVIKSHRAKMLRFAIKDNYVDLSKS